MVKKFSKPAPWNKLQGYIFITLLKIAILFFFPHTVAVYVNKPVIYIVKNYRLYNHRINKYLYIYSDDRFERNVRNIL